MTFVLVPKPWGYYAECGARNEPTIDADLNYLFDADAHTTDQPWSLRAEVLIVRVPEPKESTL